jgi:hypothetical protein
VTPWDQWQALLRRFGFSFQDSYSVTAKYEELDIEARRVWSNHGKHEWVDFRVPVANVNELGFSLEKVIAPLTDRRSTICVLGNDVCMSIRLPVESVSERQVIWVTGILIRDARLVTNAQS